MLDIYAEVARTGLPNFMVAHVVLLSNLQLEEWDKLITSAQKV